MGWSDASFCRAAAITGCKFPWERSMIIWTLVFVAFEAAVRRGSNLDNVNSYDFNDCIFFRPFQARNIGTSEIAAIKIVKLDPGMLTVRSWHNMLTTAYLQNSSCKWIFFFVIWMKLPPLSVSQKRRSISVSQEDLGQNKVGGSLSLPVFVLS